MEAEELMILRDLPVDTRNYTIIDNITGKPIDQDNYTLTIDPEVIKKLNELKKINEEKVKQAALKDQYDDDSFVSTFTPTDNAVFTPMYNDEYIDYRDFNEEAKQLVEENKEEIEEEKPDIPTGAPEITQSDTLLARVKARDPKERVVEEPVVEEEPKEELDYISTYDPNQSVETTENEETQSEPVDNSVFTPEMAGLQQASEQIVKIDTEKLGEDLKRSKTERKTLQDKVSLDKMEIISGRKVAWMAYILFFIPLLFKRTNRFVRIHANDGLSLNIVEILSVLLIGQYLLLPKFVENINDTWHWVSLIGGVVGAGLLFACAVSLVVMLIASLMGKHFQSPWLGKHRIIKVPNERTSD